MTLPLVRALRGLLACLLASPLTTAVLFAAEPPAATTSPTAEPAAQPDTEPAPTLQKLRIAQRSAIAAQLDELPRVPPQPFPDIVRIRTDPAAGLFVVTPLRETDGDVTFDTPRSNPDDLSPLVRLNVSGKPTTEPLPPAFFRLTIHRFSDADMIYAETAVFAHRDMAQFQLTYDAEGPRSHYSVQLIQSPRIGGQIMGSPDEVLSLTIRRIDAESGEVTTSLRLTAPDFDTLRRKYPRETAAHLRPLFEQLGQVSPLFAADERAAWQVLGVPPNLTADDQARLDQILAGLEADRFADRQRAQQALRALGQAGALAARTLDRNKLTPNQNAELDAFLALYSPLAPDEVSRLAASPDFLLDCLELSIPELRSAAWDRLRKLTPLPDTLTFSPNAPEHTRAEQVRALRNHLARQH